MLIYIISGDFDVALHFLMTKSARLVSSPMATFEGTVKELWSVLFEDETFAMTCALEPSFRKGRAEFKRSNS